MSSFTVDSTKKIAADIPMSALLAKSPRTNITMFTLLEPIARLCAFLALLAFLWAFTDQWHPVPECIEEIGCVVILLLLPLAVGYSHFGSAHLARHLATVNLQAGAIASHKATSSAEIVAQCVEENASNSGLQLTIGDDLPEGWESAWSDAHERRYYFSHATGERTWEKPAVKSIVPHVIASASLDGTITHWGSDDHQHKFMLGDEAGSLSAVAFSPENMAVVTGGCNGTARVWNAATGKCEHIFNNSGGTVCSIVLSPCGEFLLTGLDNHSAQLWHLPSSGDCPSLPRSVWTGHTSTVASVAFSLCSSLAATGSLDATSRIYNIASGDCEHVLQGHIGEVFSVAFSPCSQLLASASQDGTARVWSIGTGHCIMTLDGNSTAVRSLAFSPRGDLMATGYWDGSMKLWDVQGGTCQVTFPSCAKAEPILSLAFSADGSTIATGHVNAVRLWNSKSGVCSKMLEGHKDVVQAVAIIAMPTSARVVTKSPCTNITMFALLVPFGRFSALLGLLLCICAFLDQGYPKIKSAEDLGCGAMLLMLLLAFGFQFCRSSNSKACHLTTKASDLQTGTTTSHKADMLADPQSGTITTKKADVVREEVEEADYWNGGVQLDSDTDLPDGWESAWSDLDEQSYYFCRATGVTTWEKPVIKVAPLQLCMSTASLDGTIRLWGVNEPPLKLMLEDDAYALKAVAISRANSTVVTGGCDGAARVWDASTGRCEHIFNNGGGVVCSVALSPCGKLLLTGLDDHCAQLWRLPSADASSRAESTELGIDHPSPELIWNDHEAVVAAVAFSPCSTLAATGSWDGTARLYNVSTGLCEQTFEGHTAEIFSVAFSPCGELVATVSQDGTARLWTVCAGRCVMTFGEHNAPVRSVAFSPCGDLVAAGCLDGSMKIWDVQSGVCQMTCLPCIKADPIFSLAFSANGSTIATGHINVVRLWNCGSGVCFNVLEGHTDIVQSLAISS